MLAQRRSYLLRNAPALYEEFVSDVLSRKTPPTRLPCRVLLTTPHDAIDATIADGLRDPHSGAIAHKAQALIRAADVEADIRVRVSAGYSDTSCGGSGRVENLEHLRSLESLDLSFNNISEISGLDTLTNLTTLSLFPLTS